MWENGLSEHQIRGWIAISVAGLQGLGSQKRQVFFTVTGIIDANDERRVRKAERRPPRSVTLVLNIAGTSLTLGYTCMCTYIYIYIYILHTFMYDICNMYTYNLPPLIIPPPL